MSLELRLGQKLKWSGIGYQVLSLHGDAVTLINDRTGATKEMPLSRLEQERDEGEIKFSAPPIDLETAPLLFASNREALSAQVDRRRKYVDAVMLEGKRGCRRIIDQVINRVSRTTNDPHPPGVTTVYDWVRRYRDTRDIQQLVPAHAGKGNQASRISETVLTLFLQVMDSFYLQSNRPSAADAHRHLNGLIHLHNEKHPKQREKPLSYKTVVRLLRRYVDPYWGVVRREGAAAAKRQFRSTGEGIVSTYPMERIEIDHTILDVIVVDPVSGEVIGRPTFTWALDHYSRVILGFTLSFESPKTSLVLRCLEQVMQDKTPLLATRGVTPSRRWDMHGRPNFLVLDNGAEFHSRAFKEACSTLAISMQYCPPGQPWFKGRAERFVGTLNSGLIHLLPGTTRSNAKARGDYKSEAMAILPLKEVEKLVTRFIVEIYHERRHSTLGMTPRQAWEEGTAEFPPSVVHNPANLKLDLALRKECTLTNGRVQFETLRYASPLLTALEKQLGKHHRKVMVAVLESDISVAYVFDPIRKCVIEVPCRTNGVTAGMTMDEYKLLRKSRNRCKDEPDMAVVHSRVALARDMQQLNKRAEEKRDREKKGRKFAGRSPNPRPAPAPEPEVLGQLNRKKDQRLKEFAERTPPPQISTPANASHSPFDYDLDDDVI